MPLYPQESYGNDPSSYLTNPNTPGRQPSPFKAPEFVDPEYIEKFRELPDGSALFVVGEKAGDDEFPADSGDFYENLAEHLDDSVLDGLSEELMEAIQSDKDSRQEWESSASIILKYLGWDIDDYKTKSLCKAVDNTLSTTLMNFFAMAKEALFPSKGPAKGQVEGIPQEDMIERAERVAIFINYFLTVMDKVYYPDKHRLILYVALLGSAFTKVVMDPILGRPSARLVKPQDLIINNECTSILESSRITHAIKLTRKDILIKERDGVYIKGVIKNYDDDREEVSTVNRTINKMDGVTKSTNTDQKKYLFDFYECHAELEPKKLKDRHMNAYEDGEEDSIPRPYIIEICCDTKKIASIRRNWKQEDDKFKRIECFVHYYFLPGFGLYSVGLGHLQGSNAIVLTNMLRQTLDNMSFSNFPGGFIDDTAQQENTNITVNPGQFQRINTDGRPVEQLFGTLPYRDSSPISIQLRQELKGDTATLGGAAQQAAPVGNTATPVGTTLAQIEVNDRLPSNILESFTASLGYELQLLKGLFANYFGDEPYPFNVPGNHYQIMRQDFSDNINIVPVANPNLSTNSQRVIINEILIKIAKENPNLFDVREAFKRFLKSMKVEDVDALMPKPQEIIPLDPITENMNLINGKGARAGIEQDHQSHIISHSPLMQIPAIQQDPQKAAALQAHIAEHQAFEYLVQIQMAMGMPMPDPQALQDPQVQNQIAMMAAQATQQIQQQQQAQNPQISPTVVAMQEIEQRREASHLKHKEAQLRAETEAFKTQTQFESDKLKMEVEKETTEEKNKTSLAIARMKQKESE